MAALKEHNPRLAEELEKTAPGAAAKPGEEFTDDELKIEYAASGAPTMLVRGIYIHSRRDPEREAERLAEDAAGSCAVEAIADSNEAALVLGFGLGYSASALAKKFPQRPIIVVEKRPQVLKKAMEARDLRELFSRNKLIFVLGGSGEGVSGALSLFGASSGSAPLVLQNRPLIGLDEDWYTSVNGRINAWFSRTDINRATLQRFGKRWVRNLSLNLESIRDIPGISRLGGLLDASGIPAFLAAAGPSLDSAGPLLTEIYNRCLIVAVDTSLRFLLDRGINPDFVVSVDPQYWNFRHLDRSPAPKTRLVAESAVYPPVLRHCFGGIFLCASFFPLGRFIENRLDTKGDLGAGGSVATSAWDFIRLLGARELWISGLDLSFPERRTHFRGALFEEKSHTESGRFSPAETWNFRALRDGQSFPAKSRGGASVLTDKRLSLYASWFENRFREFPELKNFCFSDHGLEIKGLETAPPEELLKLPERRQEIDKLLKEVYEAIDGSFYEEDTTANRAESYKNALTALIDGLGKVKNLAEDAAARAGKAASRNRQRGLEKPEQEQIFKALDASNKAITESEVKEIAGFLFPETTGWDAEIAAKTSDPLTKHLEFSFRFYQALAEAAGYNLLKLSS